MTLDVWEKKNVTCDVTLLVRGTCGISAYFRCTTISPKTTLNIQTGSNVEQRQPALFISPTHVNKFDVDVEADSLQQPIWTGPKIRKACKVSLFVTTRALLLTSYSGSPLFVTLKTSQIRIASGRLNLKVRVFNRREHLRVTRHVQPQTPLQYTESPNLMKRITSQSFHKLCKFIILHFLYTLNRRSPVNTTRVSASCHESFPRRRCQCHNFLS